MTIPKHFKIPLDPVAHPDAVIKAGNTRFTVLTPRLIRMESSPTGEFEDHASQAFWFRCQPIPTFRVSHHNSILEITTDSLRIQYKTKSGEFGPDSLSVELFNPPGTWHYGDWDPKNLHGTARTLDGANGWVRLEQGLMSQAGWAVVDDSHSLVFSETGWLESRKNPENLDLYFFGYGHDYHGCLRDYCKVSGEVPMIPRWVLGNWWSRYWEYSAEELGKLMADFRTRQIPLAVCIIDMDWHITQTGNRSSGWTGYTWNRSLFPDPQTFVSWLHDLGLHTALILHPAEGVHPHEEQYDEIARYMEIDPATKEPVIFDISDPKFTRAYFEILHHPMEEMGIDFWWVDWQQGNRSKVQHLDPLWWLNHLHFLDLARNGKRRSFIFSRWGGLGNHRYPIGFSGDSVVSWESLDFQPYFTATAANVAYGWWSHDIGGHMSGIEDPELYTRWVQWGVFSPILRLHSTKNPYHDRIPWGYDAEVFEVTRSAMQLRHSLIPYIYSMAWRNHLTCLPLITPMYYSHPENEAAYRATHQYWFGSELIAAPFTSPAEGETRLAKQSIWLPDGDWFNFFTGEYHPGGQWYIEYGSLADIPVFAKAGAIVPLGPKPGWGGLDNPAELEIHIFPGAGNRFELYEDDGETEAYRKGAHCITSFTQEWKPGELRFNIQTVKGDTRLIPHRRNYRLVVHGILEPAEIALTINDRVEPVEAEYDMKMETWQTSPILLSPNDQLRMVLSNGEVRLMSKRDRRVEKIRHWLRRFHMETGMKHFLHDELPQMLEKKGSLAAYNLTGAQMAVIMNTLYE